MAVRASTRKRTRAASGSAVKKAQHSGPTSSGTELGPKPVPKSPPPAAKNPRSRKKKAQPAAKQPGAETPKEPAKEAPQADPANQPLPFIEFVAEHQPGSVVEGEVTQFSSHGAYITVGNVRCYAPLKLLGTPAPRSAREVLKRGETRTFVVHAIHAARRGIDVALPDVAAVHQTVTEAPTGAGNRTDQAPDDSGADLPESEATLAPTKKAPAKKKAAAKKAPAKKTTAARKATAAKKATKKTTARKTTARKTTARKAPAKK